MRFRDIATAIKRENPFDLTPEERVRLEIYRRCERYLHPPMDNIAANNLYGSAIAGQQTLAGFKALPDYITSIFNYIPKICAADRAAMINDFGPEKIYFPGDAKLTKQLQEILRRNRFKTVILKLLTNGTGKGDGYIKIVRDEEHPAGVRWLPLSPEHVFPILDPHDCERVLAYKIMYRYKAVNTSKFRGLLTMGGFRDYTEIIDAEEVNVYIDGRRDDERSYRHDLGTIPMVHIPNLPMPSDFFGLPTPYHIYDDIDAVNLALSNELERQRFYGFPQVIARGVHDSVKMKWGHRRVHYLPEGGNLELLEWRSDSGILNSVALMVQALRDKMPQFLLDQVSGSGAWSGEALMTKLQPFISHISVLESMYGDGLKEAAALTIRMAADIKETPDAEIDWGMPLPRSVSEQLTRFEKERALGLKSREMQMREYGIRLDEIEDDDAKPDGSDN